MTNYNNKQCMAYHNMPRCRQRPKARQAEIYNLRKDTSPCIEAKIIVNHACFTQVLIEVHTINIAESRWLCLSCVTY